MVWNHPNQMEDLPLVSPSQKQEMVPWQEERREERRKERQEKHQERYRERQQ